MTMIRTLAAALLFLGVALGQNPPAPPNESPPNSIDESFGFHLLREVLDLDDTQIERLMEINLELEDATFPLHLEYWKQEWQLSRELRATEPDETMVEMIEREIGRIFEQIKITTEEHRKRVRLLLSFKQIEGLDRLEEALELSEAAWEAVSLNLVGPLESRFIGLEDGYPAASGVPRTARDSPLRPMFPGARIGSGVAFASPKL